MFEDNLANILRYCFNGLFLYLYYFIVVCLRKIYYLIVVYLRKIYKFLSKLKKENNLI